MLKVKKLVLVVIVFMLVSFIFGNVNSYATNVRTITATTSSNNNTNSNTEDDNTTSADEDDEEDEADNTTTNSVRNISGSSNYSNRNSNSNTNSNTISNVNTTSNSSSLPYTGTKSSVVFVGIALVASAAYAYRKVSEYKNV